MSTFITRTLLTSGCVLTLMWCLGVAGVRAEQPDLVVVLSTPQDEVLADKLAELIREPFERVRAAELADKRVSPPTAAAVCRTPARLELSLDSAHYAVRLLRCRDATVLARGLDPEAARQSPFLGAFVAAELLSINRELETVEAREARAGVVEPPQASENVHTPAAPSGGAFEAIETPRQPDVTWSLLLRAGAELTLWGAPFDRAIRPSLGVGLAMSPRGLPVAFFAELCAGLFARAQVTRGAEQLTLQRHDLQLRAGLSLPVGPFMLSGFALARASLTSADYSADLNTSSTRVRYGVGAGIQADVPLSRSLAVYTQVSLDIATSRSDYTVVGGSWVRDPSSLFWVGLGLSLHL